MSTYQYIRCRFQTNNLNISNIMNKRLKHKGSSLRILWSALQYLLLDRSLLLSLELCRLLWWLRLRLRLLDRDLWRWRFSRDLDRVLRLRSRDMERDRCLRCSLDLDLLGFLLCDRDLKKEYLLLEKWLKFLNWHNVLLFDIFLEFWLLCYFYKSKVCTWMRASPNKTTTKFYKIPRLVTEVPSKLDTWLRKEYIFLVTETVCLS